MSKVALILAYDKAGRLLFGRRNDNKRYTLPGGHLEPGESPAHAAARELKEETSLEAKDLILHSHVELSNGTELYTFRCEVEGKPNGENDPDKECDTWRFIDCSNGVPANIWDNLAGPKSSKENIVKRLYDMKKTEEALFQNAEWILSQLPEGWTQNAI